MKTDKTCVPISNWTELDVWSYIEQEQIEIPSIYFSHKRKVFLRDGMIWSHSPYVYQEENEEIEERIVRLEQCRYELYSSS
jgi:sulfate adenylyltransferase subunit 2